MEIIHLLTFEPEGRSLLERIGYEFVETAGDVLPLAQPVTPAQREAIEQLAQMAARPMFEREHLAGSAIDLVVGVAQRQSGIAETLTECVAAEFTKLQPTPTEYAMVYFSASGLRVYYRGKELRKAAEISALVGSKRMFFVSSIFQVNAHVTHVMRTAIEPKNQPGVPEQIRPLLIRGHLAPVIRDLISQVTAFQLKIAKVVPPVLTLATLDLPPKKRQLRSGEIRIFRDDRPQ